MFVVEFPGSTFHNTAHTYFAGAEVCLAVQHRFQTFGISRYQLVCIPSPAYDEYGTYVNSFTLKKNDESDPPKFSVNHHETGTFKRDLEWKDVKVDFLVLVANTIRSGMKRVKSAIVIQRRWRESRESLLFFNTEIAMHTGNVYDEMVID